MSKKCVINIFESTRMVLQIGVNDKGKAVVCSTYMDDIEELNPDYINEHFGDLQDTAYQKGFEDGKAVREKGCEGCRYTVIGSDTTICSQCCNAYYNQWTAKETNYDIIRNGIQNWVTELNVKAEDIQKILEDMKA